MLFVARRESKKQEQHHPHWQIVQGPGGGNVLIANRLVVGGGTAQLRHGRSSNGALIGKEQRKPSPRPTRRPTTPPTRRPTRSPTPSLPIRSGNTAEFLAKINGRPTTRFAYLFILYNECGKYAKAFHSVLVNAKRMRDEGSTQDIVLLVQFGEGSPDVPTMTFSDDHVRALEAMNIRIYYAPGTGIQWCTSLMAMRALQLVQYERVMVLGAYTFVRGNLDHLFPPSSAVAAPNVHGSLEPEGDPLWIVTPGAGEYEKARAYVATYLRLCPRGWQDFAQAFALVRYIKEQFTGQNVTWMQKSRGNEYEVLVYRGADREQMCLKMRGRTGPSDGPTFVARCHEQALCDVTPGMDRPWYRPWRYPPPSFDLDEGDGRITVVHFWWRTLRDADREVGLHYNYTGDYHPWQEYRNRTGGRVHAHGDAVRADG